MTPTTLLPDGRLAIPPDYDTWVDSLRDHLDIAGDMGDLAKHLASELSISPEGARVKLSRLINGHHPVAIDVFFIIARWLANRQNEMDA